MTVAEFIAIWRKVDVTERSGAQQHFLGLCELLGHPKPVEEDPTGESFTFERGAEKNTGGDGFADVWKKGFFGWEYKGKHRNLEAAYQQLLRYAQALENPPLMVVCDMERIIIRTNFTNTPTVKHEIALEELVQPEKLALLRSVFFEPEKLKPGQTIQSITTEAARQLAEIAQSMRKRGLPALEVAHFLDRMIFCLFAEDVGLLPKGLFARVLKNSQHDPALFRKVVSQLFEAMAEGGLFGEHKIMHFNGNLFTDAKVLEMEGEEIERIARISTLDWSAVDPSIFGTLFERGLDPEKRTQLGAHYTSRADIEVLVEPVVMQPLRREWEEIRRTCDNLLTTGRKSPGPEDAGRKVTPAVRTKAVREAQAFLRRFLVDRLPSVTVLDPACGSGNFLYVTLQRLKDLEKEVILYAARNNLGGFIPMVSPKQLYGIEINPYAYELAQMTVWIGHLQWIRDNGLSGVSEPVLQKLNNFQCKDAIIDLTDPANPREPEWPKVDFVVGNPPFLGDKIMRSQLGGDYLEKLWQTYSERIPRQSDLCCYWFEKARVQVQNGLCGRAGLLATQGIRGGANREVLKRIKANGRIFFAESDRPWVLDGANVHVSMAGFDNGTEMSCVLDGKQVAEIHSNLSATADITTACKLPANEGLSFIGVSQHGPFELSKADASSMLASSGNPNGRPNSDIVLPILNALEIARRSEERWVVSFPAEVSRERSAHYESPFEYLVRNVKPVRDRNNRTAYRERWWIHGEPRQSMQPALLRLDRFLATPRVGKHRLFVWVVPPVLPSDAVVAFARSDDAFFGVLHSRIHEVWALKLGTRLETRPRYTPTTCFETFPLPECVMVTAEGGCATPATTTTVTAGGDCATPATATTVTAGGGCATQATATAATAGGGCATPTMATAAAIAGAARELDGLRNNWLNPPEWTREEVLEFPGSVDGPWARYVVNADAKGIGTVRYPRTVARDAECAGRLAKRTLTNLYNARPDWLRLAHEKLDAAVAAAYGWAPGLSDEEIIERLLALNRERSGER